MQEKDEDGKWQDIKAVGIKIKRKKCGYLIGKQGNKKEYIRRQSGLKVLEIPKIAEGENREEVVHVNLIGDDKSREVAIEMITDWLK